MDTDLPSTPYGMSLITPQITETSFIDEDALPPTTQTAEPWNSLPTVPNDVKTEQQDSVERVSKITDDLKKSLVSQIRKPTPSPFFSKGAPPNSVTTVKSFPLPTIVPEGYPLDAPTTADVLNDIDSFDQKPSDVKLEVGSTIGDSSLSETSQIDQMGTSVSPKKRFIIRSQSQTDATPSNIPVVNNLHRVQKPSIETNNLVEHFPGEIITNDLKFSAVPASTVKQELDFSLKNPGDTRQSFSTQGRTELNPVHSTINKGHIPAVKTKRSIDSTTNGINSIKMIPVHGSSAATIVNEVTSSTHSQNGKRLKTMMPTANGHGSRAEHELSTIQTLETVNTENYGANSDDQRKKQIRDSNREAARRCRERRRQYIEHLEADLDKLKQEIQILNDKLSHAERENVQLRTIVAEGNFLHGRRVQNEIPLNFQLMTNNTNGIDHNGLQRNYHN